MQELESSNEVSMLKGPKTVAGMWFAKGRITQSRIGTEAGLRSQGLWVTIELEVLFH